MELFAWFRPYSVSLPKRWRLSCKPLRQWILQRYPLSKVVLKLNLEHSTDHTRLNHSSTLTLVISWCQSLMLDGGWYRMLVRSLSNLELDLITVISLFLNSPVPNSNTPVQGPCRIHLTPWRGKFLGFTVANSITHLYKWHYAEKITW